jgi:chemotaxis response regulator CheB
VPLEFRSHLDQLLSAAGTLPATFATDGEVRKNGLVYVAPPGHHLSFAASMRTRTEAISSDATHATNGPRQSSARRGQLGGSWFGSPTSIAEARNKLE